MLEFLKPAPPILPEAFLRFDLLEGFIWYLSLAFVASTLLRLRFYWSVYDLARHVSYSCPRIYELIHEHWFLCVQEGIAVPLAIYGSLLLAYMAFNRFVWPLATITISDLALVGAPALVFNLILFGIMITLDLLLMAQVAVVDTQRVKEDLNTAERWLGGRLNAILLRLGRWNPIKRYADAKAAESMVWLNQVFRTSLVSITSQLIIRLLVAISLFTCFLLYT